MELRPYQRAAVDACYNALRHRADNPCIVIPTGGGKTPIIATICRDAVTQWRGRVLVLSHVKELLQQAADKLAAVCPGVPVGIYSAGLKRRDTKQPVIVAGIQSVHSRACEMDPFNLIVVDEAHLIPPSGDGMYLEFLREAAAVNPEIRVIGLTATAFRMTTGPICARGNILNHICYEVGVKELIRDGYLSRLTSKGPQKSVDLENVGIRGGEFVEGELQDVMMDPAVMKAAVGEIAHYTASRKSTLIFCCGVDHAKAIADLVSKRMECEVGVVCGDTPAAQRADMLERFKAGTLRYLANVNVLTTGFDAPNVDCVVMLRPTLSAGLYYQMVGRGFRIAPGKENCLVLDYGQNVQRHGPVDCIRTDGKAGGTGARAGQTPGKECPDCNELIAAGYSHCPECGHEFPPPEPREERMGKHASTASDKSIISEDATVEDAEVLDVEYRYHQKKGDPNATPTLRVIYRLSVAETVSEWVCFEHPEGGIARAKARVWWAARSGWPIPQTVAEAEQLCGAGAVAYPLRIKVRRGEKFPEILGVELTPKPAEGEYAGQQTIADDIPF